MAKQPIIREDDGELLGYIERQGNAWTAQTVFGYVFTRSEHKHEAEEVVRSQGLNILQGVWQYRDKSDGQWYPCVLKEVFPHRVIVVRTNEMGFQDNETYKYVTITNPNETNLIQA